MLSGGWAIMICRYYSVVIASHLSTVTCHMRRVTGRPRPPPPPRPVTLWSLVSVRSACRGVVLLITTRHSRPPLPPADAAPPPRPTLPPPPPTDAAPGLMEEGHDTAVSLSPLHNRVGLHCDQSCASNAAFGVK